MSIYDPNETAKRSAEITGEQSASAGPIKEFAPEPEGEELMPAAERDGEPLSGPKLTTPLPPPFAITSDGRVLLNIDACPDLKLEGRTIFRCIALSEEETAYARRKIENTIHDAAGHLGGMIKRREPGESGGNNPK